MFLAFLSLEVIILSLKGQKKLRSQSSLNIRNPNRYFFHSCIHHNWLPYQILSVKTGKNVQIDQQTMEIWSKKLDVTLSVSEEMNESVGDTLVREKLIF